MNKGYRLYQENQTMKILGQQTFLLAARSPELKELEAAYCSEKKQKKFLFPLCCFKLL